MQTLATKHGKYFEIAYAKAMVTGHENALHTLDDVFLPKVSNMKLKKFLKDTRTHVIHHLDKAKKMEADMKA